MKKRFLSILTSFASIISVVSAVPHTQCAGATEDGYPEQPPYQYIGDDAVEFVDREKTYYFYDSYQKVNWEFNKVYSLSPEYVKTSFDIQEIRNKRIWKRSIMKSQITFMLLMALKLHTALFSQSGGILN